MFVVDTSIGNLAVWGILLTVIFFIIVAIWRHKDKYVTLLEKKLEPLSPENTQFQAGIEFPLIADLFNHKYELITKGKVELTMNDISPIWEGMFEDLSITYLRVTSYIDPIIWENAFMVRYDHQQRQNIGYIKKLDDKTLRTILDGAKSIFEELRVPWKWDDNFERTFILSKEQLGDVDVLVDIIDIICEQNKYFNLRLVNEETLLNHERRDFGIAVSKDQSIWIYELIIFGKNTLLGGTITIDKEEITNFIRMYDTLQSKAMPIPEKVDFRDVAKIVSKMVNVDSDTIIKTRDQKLAKVGGHKCLRCFLESEKRIKEDDWHNFEEARRIWYEMLVAENKKVTELVEEYKPKRILEVGCGTGRFINLMADLGLNEFEEIIGIDGDSQMYDYANKKFGKYMPKIKIFKMEVKLLLPYTQENYFDLCINAMNIVGWQENEKIWLKEMLRCSKSVFFTLYKHGYEDLRLEMYQSKGHEISDIGVHKNSDGQIVLGDCAVISNVKSRDYTYEEVENICKTLSTIYNAKYEIDKDSNKLLFLCFIKKNAE
jgi:SAM-dependent methyltransferase